MQNLFDYLFTPVTSIDQLQSTTVKALEKIGITQIIDLIFHLPINIANRKFIKNFAAEDIGKLVTFIAEVIELPAKKKFSNFSSPYKVYCELDSTEVHLIFFGSNIAYLRSLLLPNNTCVISGKLDSYKGHWQITHPDHIGSINTLTDWIGVKPIYPLTSGVSQKVIQNIIKIVIDKLPLLPEWLATQTNKLHPQWSSWFKAIKQLHCPKDEDSLSAESFAKSRLAYDELLAYQIAIQLVRHHHRHKQNTLKKNISTTLFQRGMQILPFSLTKDQLAAIEDIKKDMQTTTMHRLLQGDVGSGKTIVAFLACLLSIGNNRQTVIMAPTEILARQHFATISDLTKKIDVSVGLLLGQSKLSEKNKIYQLCQNNEMNIIIGTHALIQPKLTFANLGLVIIDEQHRFGVEQRLALVKKGNNVDYLSMTATPIPRTLMLTCYGDLDTSKLYEKPKNRQDIITRTICINRIDEIIAGLKREINNGGKIYWVCPLIEDSKILNLAAAKARYDFLNQYFPQETGLLHGKLTTAKKNAIMSDFITGKIKILISTTVIEVGVDVQDATIMIIEHAEFFGLAQLHQLRGRIGRGEQKAICLLLYDPNIKESGKARLNIVKTISNGFLLAEKDWKIRGGGEFLGQRQSGVPNFKFVDWQVHQPLLREALYEAKDIITTDPFLSKTAQGQAIKILLKIFKQEEMLHYLKI